MGKYQKNIEAARRISVMQYLETYHPGELVRKTDKEYRTKTHSSLPYAADQRQGAPLVLLFQAAHAARCTGHGYRVQPA